MRRLLEYDIYLPVSSEAGDPIDPELLQRYRRRLVDLFGGLTDFRHRSDGAWKVGGVTFHDEILLLRVLAEDQAVARRVLRQLQTELEAELDQQKILIIEREVSAL